MLACYRATNRRVKYSCIVSIILIEFILSIRRGVLSYILIVGLQR